MSDITVINDTQQSELVTNGLAKNGELYLKAAGSTDEGAIVVYDSGSWRTFANEFAPAGPFLTYEITNPGGDFTLRSSGTVSYDVDWGDGTSESSTSNALAHTYTAGSYTIQITTSGTYRPNFSNQAADSSQITAVEIDDGINLGTTLQSSFNGASNMTDFTASSATSNVTTLYQTWYFCSSLSSLSQIDSSNVANFYRAWFYCSSLTSFPQIDTSSGTNFKQAWYFCSSLTDFPANVFDTTGTLSSNDFQGSWTGCALTAQSIENILTSLDTNGASSVALGIDGGTNAAYSTWSSAAQTALSNLQTKGWTVSYNT